MWGTVEWGGLGCTVEWGGAGGGRCDCLPFGGGTGTGGGDGGGMLAFSRMLSRWTTVYYDVQLSPEREFSQGF